ncbi:nuclear transport factor 2 family protein [Exiguobacterium aestuarii]|uniref:Nuclear transport factor 2 family protein n=1 Tax=Exiguobacterium aestuarii TaxID=273527 RepID=A0ABW2PHM7_9BACL|nr:MULTISPECIES: nuclear transport factor 2 family protein [Exiguobacterium]MCT4787285.1 nuclear transport factor 2 family protein [Exiguobacterium aestuarii]
METLNMKQLSDERSAFQVSGDIEGIESLMHHSFRYVDSSGRQFDKETFLDQYVDPTTIQWIAQDTITFEETIKGDLAVVQLLLEERFILGTNAYEGRFWALHLYVKENDTWFWQGGQATMINEG